MRNLSLAELKKLIPNYVINIAEELQKAGHEAYLVGGSLRDVLLGREPEDYDVSTDAYPDDIVKIFSHSIPTGAKFGTITVVGEDENDERFDVEVTTFRSEADYMGGRWPTKVKYAKTIEEDLSRRDFTFNAMALNLQEFDTAKTDEDVKALLKDPFHGLEDLEKKLVRAVGDPVERFSEDGLRPVRGCRFAAQLNFEIEARTLEAMKKTNHITKQVSVERLRDELLKLLYKSPKPSVGLRLMRDTGILALIIPELLEGIGVNQPDFHIDDVFEHTLKTVDAAEDRVKVAALLHDIAKPRTMSIDADEVHFYGHDQMGAQLAEDILRRLKFPNNDIERVTKLIRWHMFYYPSADWREQKRAELNVRHASRDELAQHIAQSQNRKAAAGWSDGAIRRLILHVGGEEAIDDLMRLRVADAVGNPKSEFNPEEIEVFSQRIAEVRAKDMALKVTDLDISGEDLMQELDLSPGPKLGEILRHLLDLVIEDPLLNKKDLLLRLAREYLGKST